MKKVFSTIANIWRVKDVRVKLLFTLLILVIYRLGAQIPVPFIDPNVVTAMKAQMANSAGLLQFMNIFSGEAFSRATLFALSISPYITSSIVMQLLCVAIPALERMSKDEDGKKKITQITRYVTVALALITAIGYYIYLNSNSWIIPIGGDSATGFQKGFTAVVVVACYCAGASLIMWLGEKINENGIGNGISMILFANIVSSFPTTIVLIFELIFNFDKVMPGVQTTPTPGLNQNLWWIGTIIGVLGLIMCVALIGFMVWMTNSERRLPVQYAKRVVGRKMYGGQNTTLPLKLNMTGVMPIIFASSIISIPATIAMFAGKQNETIGFWGWAAGFNQYNWLYIVLFGLLLVAFAYFYVAISFNPVEVANNLKKNGGSIPGIRTGKPTSDYIARILSRVTFIGAICLMLIALLPMVLGCIGGNVGTDGTNYNWAYSLTFFAFSGNSLLIVVGVVLETAREIEAQMTMRNFKGFLE